MLLQLISRNSDLKQIADAGYHMELVGAHLCVHHVPYVNSAREVKYGTLITIFDEHVTQPNTHVIGWMGDYPCDKGGKEIEEIRHATPNEAIGNDIIVNYRFSNKPKSGYKTQYEKIQRYVEMISAPAKSLDDSVTEFTGIIVDSNESDYPFKYRDTHSARAHLDHINAKFSKEKVAIIGLGGTGSYVLDLISKTNIKEIHLYDGDAFEVHNAFRAPGAYPSDSFSKKNMKASMYQERYSLIRNKLFAHDYYVTHDNISELNEMTFVFVCIDNNEARKLILDSLISMGIPFIDVGMGVNAVDEKLIATVRTTTGTLAKHDHLTSRVPFEDTGENEYATNIQIADLNCLNATFAVIKWKKMVGFYHDDECEFHSAYIVNTNEIVNEDSKA